MRVEQKIEKTGRKMTGSTAAPIPPEIALRLPDISALCLILGPSPNLVVFKNLTPCSK
jgi:hypothetical protein